MKQIDKLTVTYHGRKVGTLTMTPDGRRCAFAYAPTWLERGFSISPIDLPLRSELFVAPERPFWGNFGIFEDSLPDGYGRYLLGKLLREHGIDDMRLTPIERLCIVGSAGMGALCYEPEALAGEKKDLPAMDELQRMALDVLSETSDAHIDTLYYNSGNSGGCRPKCVMRDAEGEWIVKFRHTYDPQDMGRMEYHYNRVAALCGIAVAPFKLVEGRYFASRRWDRDGDTRLHVATAAALLNQSIALPALDYRTLLQLTAHLTRDKRQVQQMYRRMVFNVLADNKDDHAKNFSFVCRDGRWELAPAYDLTHSPQGYHGERATTVNGNGRPTIDDVRNLGGAAGITAATCRDIINECATRCREEKILSTDYQQL